MKAMNARGWMALGLVGLAAVGTSLGQAKGEKFPDFSGTDMRTGKKISLADFQGKVVLIDFWATWCGPCVAELPNVIETHKKFNKKGLEIISISLDNDVNKCKSFVEDRKLDWHHIADGKGWKAALAQKFGIQSIPAMFVIGRDGKVIAADVRGPELEQAIEKGIAQTAGVVEPVNDETDKEANAELAKAEALYAKGAYKEAVELYDEIGVKYVGRTAAKTANERARDLRLDPKVQEALKDTTDTKKEAEAEKKGGEWLKIARQMAESKNYELSRKYYQKILDNYPDSKMAATAKTELAKLPAK